MSDNKSNILDRLKDFNDKLFKFWQCNNESFLSCRRLNISQMIELKHNVHDVNNIITLLVTYLFIKKLNDQYKFANTLNINDIENKPNANGYDFIYPIGKRLIVAEVKCNLPCGNKKHNTYGADQIKGIIKDLSGLVKLKDKAQKQISKDDFNNAYKFLVVLEDEARNTQKAIRDLKDKIKRPSYTSNGVQDLRRDLTEANMTIDDILQEDYYNEPNNPPRPTNIIYVVYITPKDNLISELLDEKNNECNISAQL